MRVTLIDTAWGDRDVHIELDATPKMLDACWELFRLADVLPLTGNQREAFFGCLSAQVRAIAQESFERGMEFLARQANP